MNAIDYCISQIKQRIPKPILELAFDDAEYSMFSTQSNESLESKIESMYMREIFITDLNLIYGTRSRLPVDNASITHRDANSLALHFSSEALEGLSIVSVYNVMMAYTGAPQVATGSMGSTMGLEAAGGKTMAPVANPQTRLVGHNTVLIVDKGMMDFDWMIDVMLSNDPYLTNLDARIYPILAKTAIEGCKAYIHNNLIVKLNGGSLMGGQDLGVIAEIVDGYSDAWEVYNDYKENELVGAMVNADPLLQKNIIKAQMLPLL